ncbi:glucose-6-phosphate isomerase [Ostreiculturibacter nitratireducens]|uniref:glucose-6-phosphate isomerase n=1 Tax=Ostreiculturibacter nitratireducens TaxID=3075226 RepID=UPI0031B567FB
MRKTLLTLACASALALSSCTATEEEVAGGLIGATVGIITAKALNADRDWTIIAALSGAAIGTLVARNERTKECAYSRGDGTYRIGPCPR